MDDPAKFLAPLQPPLYYRDFTFLIGGFFFLLLLHFLPIHPECILLKDLDLLERLKIEAFGTLGNVLVAFIFAYFIGMFLSVTGKIIFEIGFRFLAIFKPKDKGIKKHFANFWLKRDSVHQSVRLARLKYLQSHFLVREEYHRIIFQGLTFRILFSSSIIFAIISSTWFLLVTLMILLLLVRIDEGIDNIREGIAKDIK